MFEPTVMAQIASWSQGSRYPVNDSSSVSTSMITPTDQLNSRGGLYEPVMNTRNMCSHTVMTIAWAPQRCISRMMPSGTCSRRPTMSV